MCHETPESIVPRIIALLRDETIPWTGNEILSRISSGDSPCELHFDATIRQMVRDRKLTSDSDVFVPTLTSTTRCRLAYVLTDEAKAPSLIQPLPVAPPSKPPTVAAAPPPPAPPSRPPAPIVPALPSPAARLEAIGRLRDERVKTEREWFDRHGADCFRAGSAAFLNALFRQVRVRGMLPRLRDALEKAQGRRIDEFERHLENLLAVNDRDGTIPVGVLDAGVKLDLMSYISLDLDRCEREIRDGRDGNPSNARELLAFLRSIVDEPSLRSPPPSAPPVSPSIEPAPPKGPETKPKLEVLHTGTTKVARSSPDDPLVGTTFGPYKIVGVIGRGGMGAVYEGLDETLDRRVALKVLHAQFAGNREYQDRFLREARNAANARLDHPNITQIYAAGREGAHPWLAMQLVRGRTLAKVLAERRTLPPDEALRIARQTAEGLSAAHAAGMIHRDIKPDNLMIDEGGRVKIMDFGLMRSVDVQKDGLTAEGLFVGTLEYASPEQCRDKPLDARTDLYSLGVVLYELLSGKRPYQSKTAFGYLTMISDPQQPPVPLRSQAPDVPPAIETLVHKLLSKRPEDRIASAQELIQSIDGLLGTAMRVSAVPTAAPAPTGGVLVYLIGGAIALAAVLVGAIVFWPKDSKPADPPPKLAEPPAKKDPDRPAPPPTVPTADAAEKEADDLYRRLNEEGSLKRLLTAYGSTRAGAQAAREALEAFEKSLPADEKFELVGAAPWTTWDVDTRDAPGGTVVFDKAKNVYVLSAASAKEQVRLLKKLKGAERGYRLRWKFADGASDASSFMVAISFSRWFETTPKGVTLFRADKEGGREKISTVRTIELKDRPAGGVLHVFPRASLILVYLDGRLLFALTEKEYALGGGLQLGMSGGSVTVESLRVLDRARD
jgi:serine/threonine protein kinase